MEMILVVTEDPAVSELIAQQVLLPQGYQVQVAHDGATALQSALKTAPDVVLASLELPGLSGRDLMAALRTQGLESAMIAIGPRGADSQAVQAFRLGAKDYVGQPLREAELVASLDRALSEVRLRRERETLAQRLAAANQQLEKRVKELTTLAGIGKAVTAMTNLGHLFTRLLEAALYVTEADVGWLILAEESSGQPVLRAGKNLPNLSALRPNHPWDDGISSLLMLSGEALTLSGPPLARLRAGQVAKSVVAVPLKARNKAIGVLVAGNRTGKPFSDRDQAMLAAVADYAVIAIVNARLFQAMEARVAALQQAHDAQVAANGRQTEGLRETVRQMRVPLQRARGDLEPLADGQAGGLTSQQADCVDSALNCLAAAQRQLDEFQPASPAGPG